VSFAADPTPFLDSKTFFPGKKVLAWFLCERFFARAKKCEKNTQAVWLSTSKEMRKKRPSGVAFYKQKNEKKHLTNSIFHLPNDKI
ncbi:MAG: hypothetical protein J6R89_00805, partial [Clostridia bacterium]|nr:hypothetical protein [Clostridia bacterium]